LGISDLTELNKKDNGTRLTLSRVFLSGQLSPLLPTARAHVIFWSLLTAGVALDLWTKKAVFHWLEHHGRVSVIDGFLQLVLAENAGAAFGIAAGKTSLLVAVSIVALVTIFSIFLFAGTRQKLVHIGLALLAAGVCGNLYDRLFNDGLVRDFIDVVYWPGRHWPAFNAADSMLCIGVGLLVISSFFTEKLGQKHARQHK